MNVHIHSVHRRRVLVVVIVVLASATAWLLLGQPSRAESPLPDALQPLSHGLAPIADVGGAWQNLQEAAGVTAQTVFPPDDRIPVQDTTAAPWRSVAWLALYDRPGHLSGTCSGSMVGFNVVLTAAHCLYDGGYVDSVLVVPGATPNSAPFGVADAYRFAVPKGWGETGNRLYDFGLVFLDGAPFKNYASPYLTVAAVPDSYLADPNLVIATAGFPGDKPAASMWFTAGFDFSYDNTFLYTRMDAYPGQSGSPIYSLNQASNEVLLVGVFSAESPLANVALRFGPDHLTALQKYCADSGCSLTTRVVTVGRVPTPAATPTRAPTAAPTPAAPTVHLTGGYNIFGGPTEGALTAADFTHCLPPGSWTALYIWDPQQQRWLHYFASTPTYVNRATVGGISMIPKFAGIVLITTGPVPNAFFPNAAGVRCPS